MIVTKGTKKLNVKKGEVIIAVIWANPSYILVRIDGEWQVAQKLAEAQGQTRIGVGEGLELLRPSCKHPKIKAGSFEMLLIICHRKHYLQSISIILLMKWSKTLTYNHKINKDSHRCGRHHASLRIKHIKKCNCYVIFLNFKKLFYDIMIIMDIMRSPVVIHKPVLIPL